jgi:hypothetical protein
VADKRPVRIAPSDPETAGLWDDLGRLAARVLPADWTLIGGLMVQLHAYEAGEMGVRATTDIDILGDARKQKAIEKIARALDDDEFELEPPSPTDGVSHRWRRGELMVDLLAPDGLRSDPPMLGGVRTVQIPGGSQALARTETVEVEINGAIAQVRRPALLGALLIKARSILVHADPDAQRADPRPAPLADRGPHRIGRATERKGAELAARLRGSAWLGGPCPDGAVPASEGATRTACLSSARRMIDASKVQTKCKHAHAIQRSRDMPPATTGRRTARRRHRRHPARNPGTSLP